MFKVTTGAESVLFVVGGQDEDKRKSRLTSTESLDQAVGGKVRLGISDIVHCLPGFRLNRQKPGQY